MWNAIPAHWIGDEESPPVLPSPTKFLHQQCWSSVSQGGKHSKRINVIQQVEYRITILTTISHLYSEAFSNYCWFNPNVFSGKIICRIN